MDSYKKGDKIIVIEEILQKKKKPSIHRGKQLTVRGTYWWLFWWNKYLEVIDEKRNIMHIHMDDIDKIIRKKTDAYAVIDETDSTITPTPDLKITIDNPQMKTGYKKGDKIIVQIGSQEKKIEMTVTGIYDTYIVANTYTVRGDDTQTELTISAKEFPKIVDVAPGALGITYDENKLRVRKMEKNCQKSLSDAKVVGYRMVKIGDEPFTNQLRIENAIGKQNYKITFQPVQDEGGNEDKLVESRI